jgi:ParB-like chromosome segregation protein Spo0J
MQFHPLADCFPLIEGDDFKALVGSILANGQREPIVLFEGMILDGRNRYRACLEAGVEPRTQEFSGTFDAARKLVIDSNIMRRHLDTSQRAMAATRLAKLADGQRQVGKFADVPTQDEAAKLLKVSERTVRDARKVIDHGEPELIEAVDRGEVAVSKAAKIAELPQDEQGEALKPKTTEQVKADRYFREQSKRLKAAQPSAPTPEPASTAFDRLCSAWTDATDTERNAFLEWTPAGTEHSIGYLGQRAHMRAHMRKLRAADKAARTEPVAPAAPVDIFAQTFATIETARREAVVTAGLMAYEFEVVEADGIWRVVRTEAKAA